MKITSSKMLHTFYKDWLADANHYENTGEYLRLDCHEMPLFSFECGLCGNLECWAWEYYEYEIEDLLEEMAAQFVFAGLDVEYPFGKDAYIKDMRVCSMHKDKDRLGWVLARINDGVDDE